MRAPRESRELEWADFAADVDACTACGLARTRNRSVPGVGDPHAEWLFVGEAPGAEEDAKGEPFVGQAGGCSTTCSRRSGSPRGNNVYIANVLKCRPPGNRTPEPAEVEACRPYLDRQIALIAPKLIVALGKSAATALLNVDATIASLRGRVHRYQGVPLIVTYHPAYLLRNLPDKAKAWEDLLSRGARFANRARAAEARRARSPIRPINRLEPCTAPQRPHLPAAGREPAADNQGNSMIRNFAALLALAATLARRGCGYNDLQTAGRRRQGRLVRGAEPVPAARRPRSEPRQHGQGLCRAGADAS